jgi:signal transduction histidine kinase
MSADPALAEAMPAQEAILLVDDTQANLMALEAVLAPLGYRQVLAKSGEEALTHLLAEDFALVLMDVQMATLDGFQTAALIRQRERTRHVPIIFVTAIYQTPEYVRRGLAIGGVIDYIFKPFDPQILRDKVAAVVSLRVYREQLVNRERVATEERERRRAAEEASRIKDVFVAVLGHELRSPLSAIRMSAEEIRSASETKEWIQIAERIISASERMSRMIATVLDYTRGQLGGGIPVSPKPMDMGKVCRSVILELQSANPKREIVFDERGDSFGKWDSDRVAQVVSNLGTNALQHAPTGSVLILLDGTAPELVKLTVHNSGAAISQTAIKDLFEPFHRAETSKGLGLGLYIVREIVRAHQGTVSVHSTDAEGTTFTVEWPRWPTVT